MNLPLIAVLAFAVPTMPASAAAPPVKKVLVIGIDGCRPDVLTAAKAPVLQGLMDGGAFSLTAQTGDITLSGPGWSSLLTGVWRVKHRVNDNRFTAPDFGRHPHFFARLKAARPAAKAVSFVHWEPIAKHIVSAADANKAVKTDAEVADLAAAVLRDDDPDAVFVHFDDVDHAGHKHGFNPRTAAYMDALGKTDALVGKLLEALRARKTYAAEDWLVIVSTDHGGSGTEHGRDIPEHRTIFLIVSGPAAVRGKIEPAPAVVDVAATALVHLGIAVDPKWEMDGKAVGLKVRNGN